jgi:hypothetical protein
MTQRLSHAIFLGSSLLKARAGGFPGDGEGCALQMGIKAVNGNASWLNAYWIWPWLRTNLAESPCGCTWGQTGYATQTPLTAIVHIFDKHIMDKHIMDEHMWTLEQLCDWIRSVEPEEVQSPTLVEEKPQKKLECHGAMLAHRAGNIYE